MGLLDDLDLSGAAGALVSGGLDIAGGALQTSANKEAQIRQHQFQEKMYRNRYQYTMEDMQSAGLNPILAYRQGGGNAPSGGSMAGAPNIMQGAAASARGLTRLSADVKMARMGTRLRRSQIAETWAKEASAATAAGLNKQLERKAKADTANVQTQTALGRTALPAAKAQEALDKTDLGEKLRQLNRVIRSVTGRDATGARH